MIDILKSDNRENKKSIPVFRVILLSRHIERSRVKIFKDIYLDLLQILKLLSRSRITIIYRAYKSVQQSLGRLLIILDIKS